MKLFRKLAAFANHPLTVFFVGGFLIISSLAELGEAVFSSEGLQGDHGTLAFGLLLTMQSLGEIGEGLGKIDEGLDSEEAK